MGRLRAGTPGAPVIALAGQPGIDCFVLNGSANEVRGLAIGGCRIAVELSGASATGNVVAANFLGVDTTGATAVPNQKGVEIDAGASSNTIGGTVATDRNVISANNIGIDMKSGTANAVVGNFIGTNATGSGALANRYGIRGLRASSGVIGGARATAGDTACTGACNVISGNDIGIQLHSGARVIGNVIGTTPTATAPLRNNTGIWLLSGSVGELGATPNVISGNGRGILSRSGTVVANYIGTEPTGTTAVPNSTGIQVEGALEGGSAYVADNLVSGNGTAIALNGDRDHPAGATIVDNVIGLALDAETPLPNGGGISVNSSNGSLTVQRNIISGNHGAALASTSRSKYPMITSVADNLIGTDRTGTVGIGNGGGIQLDEARVDIRRNVIADNGGTAIAISGYSTQSVVADNLVGTTVDGDEALPNAAGITVALPAHNARITGNTIAGNLQHGLRWRLRATSSRTTASALTAAALSRSPTARA